MAITRALIQAAASIRIRHILDEATPAPEPDTRITESGEDRVTEDGETRETE